MARRTAKTPATRKRERERELSRGADKAPASQRRRTQPPVASGIDMSDAAFVCVMRDIGYERVQGRPGPIDWKARAEELHMTEKELRLMVIGKVRKKA